MRGPESAAERRKLRVAFAILMPAAMLAACGPSEEAARNSFRQSSIESCVGASREVAAPQLAGFDWERLCSCATDRIMAGKSARELIQLEPGGPGQREAVEQCVIEMQRDGAAAAAG